MGRYERLRELAGAHRIAISFGEPMAGHTSLRIGGPADVALLPNEEALKALIPLLHDAHIPYVVIGKGSNVLVADEGIRGAVIFTKELGDLAFDAGGDATVSTRRDAGVILDVHGGCALRKVMQVSMRHGLSGIEGLVGIPGSVGGAIAGNAGAFGCEMKDVIRLVRLVLPGGTLQVRRRGEIDFGYRTATLPEGSVILSATLELQRDDPHEVRYRAKRFMAEKRSRQPVWERSAGCVFRNPAGVSAGKLIDDAGCKGMESGAIAVSTVHANFFVNKGGGTARDFRRLMEGVREAVARRCGVDLQPEIRIVGAHGEVKPA